MHKYTKHTDKHHLLEGIETATIQFASTACCLSILIRFSHLPFHSRQKRTQIRMFRRFCGKKDWRGCGT